MILEFENEEYIMVRERVLSILTDLDKYKAEFMADKMGLVATLHSLLGNAYLELNDLNLALKHHLEDLRIGEERSGLYSFFVCAFFVFICTFQE